MSPSAATEGRGGKGADEACAATLRPLVRAARTCRSSIDGSKWLSSPPSGVPLLLAGDGNDDIVGAAAGGGSSGGGGSDGATKGVTPLLLPPPLLLLASSWRAAAAFDSTSLAKAR